MALTQQKKREIILLALFATHFVSYDEEGAKEFVKFLTHSQKVTTKQAFLILDQIAKINEKKSQIEKLIKQHATSYAFERITKVELCILKILIYEMLYEQLEIKIAVSEGLRLCKKYAFADSMAFVHAILDAIYKND